jgi:taurine dioxygenase
MGNAAMSVQAETKPVRTGPQMEVTPLTGSIGARVGGVELHTADGDAVRAIRTALLEHCMLVFPRQFMGPEDQLAFARKLGEPLESYPGIEFGDRKLPSGILKLSNDGKDKVITEHWHFDGMYLAEPPAVCVLAAQELPSRGGDTMWTNQYLAFEALSAGMRELIRNLKCYYVSTRVPKLYPGNENKLVAALQPAVRKHPETGRLALYIGSPEVCRRFDGMTEDESRPLIEYLWRHGQRPDFGYRHMWQPGDVVMWDNRCTMHYAVHDYGNQPRLMHRVALKGDVAVGPD